MAFSGIIQVSSKNSSRVIRLIVCRSCVLGHGIMRAVRRHTGHVRGARSGDEERHFLEVLKHRVCAK